MKPTEKEIEVAAKILIQRDADAYMEGCTKSYNLPVWLDAAKAVLEAYEANHIRHVPKMVDKTTEHFNSLGMDLDSLDIILPTNPMFEGVDYTKSCGDVFEDLRLAKPMQENEALKAENEKLNEFIVYLKKEADVLTNRLLIAGLGLEDIRLGVAENSDWYKAEAERTFTAMAAVSISTI